MAGYIGSKAVLLSTTAAVVTGDMTVAGATTLSGAFTSLGIDDNATSTAITIDASENVGIGTSSPDRPVHLSSSGSRNYVKAETTGATNASESGFEIKTPSSNWLINSLGGSDALTFYDLGNTSERMRIDASGNVGIGVVPESWGSGWSALQLGGNGALFADKAAGSSKALYVAQNTYHDGSVNKYTETDEASRYSQSGGVHKWESAPSGSANSTVTFSERMRIDASGNVMVGGTTAYATDALTISAGGVVDGKITNGPCAYFNRMTSDGTIVVLRREDVAVGSISVTASATAYNTSSDYRLKENITPIQGAADTVMAMQPCTYTAIADGVWYDGFLAHELQEVHPRAVQGTKDAMKDEEYEVTPAVYEDVVTPAVDAVAATYDDEGLELTPAVEAAPETTESVLVTEAVMGTRSVPDMQSVDYSKLTPILTAALQEALTEIAALKVRVAALEVTP